MRLWECAARNNPQASKSGAFEPDIIIDIIIIKEDIIMANCFDCLKKIDGKHVGIFAAGVLFGTAGIKVLSGKDAKKVYTKCTAAALRAKKCVLDTASKIQESAEDIYAEAQEINVAREEDTVFDENETAPEEETTSEPS